MCYLMPMYLHVHIPHAFAPCDSKFAPSFTFKVVDTAKIHAL